MVDRLESVISKFGIALPSIDLDLLNKVVKELGQAAVDPSMWPHLMTEICRATNTTGAGLLQSDIRTADIPMTESAREIFASYFRNQLHIDDIRAIRGVPKLLRGARVVSDQDLFESERQLSDDPLYADLGQHGFKWWAAIGFWAGEAHWGLALQRRTSEGMFEQDELRALAMLADRLTETATLSKAVERKVISGINNAFALIDQPAIALDRRGYVIDVNLRAASLFDEEFGLKNQQLFVKDEAAKASLSKLIAKLQVLFDSAPLDQERIVVKRTRTPPIIIRALNIDGAARGPFSGARVILTFVAVEARRRIEPAMLVSLFGLTSAESKVAAIVGSGTSLENAADELGTARDTVRSQLKAIFAKTGTHRQAELVALFSAVR